jgi:hypothetical protein
MALHLGARMHALVHGLFRSSEDVQTAGLYDEVSLLQASVGADTASGLNSLAAFIGENISNHFGIGLDHPQAMMIGRLVRQFLQYENLFVLPAFDPNQRLTIAKHWELRNELSALREHLAGFEEQCATLEAAITAMLSPLYAACPALLAAQEQDGGITVPTRLIHTIGAIGEVIEEMIGIAFDERVVEQKIMLRLRARLERNLISASGGNPDDPRGFTRAVKWPSQMDQGQPEQLVGQYIGGTPFAALFDQTLDFTIPTAARFEHHHIVAGSGHGKTQTLQYLIARDLEAVVDGNRSVIVLDSQGDLIRNIANLKLFAPGEPLHDRIVIIDPSDVEWPVSLNLFDVGMDRLSGYAPLERERLTNSILELYDFVLGTLLSAEMTQKQNVIFRYVTRLMLHIPDATIHTLRELMEPGSEKKFAAHIAKLTGTARQFFESEFPSREFEQTKRQVLRRLWGILENQTFERMFSHPRSKLDLFAEMNAGKVILINTAKDLLKEQGTEIFGRFFIALIAQAAQERATLPPHQRTPTIVYVDEAQDYFDRNIGLILAQARKYNVGMVLAHQYLGQLEPKLLEAFAANTAIKFAGGVSAKDARTFAPMLYCQPELIEMQPKGSFAAHVRGRTKSAVPLQFPLGYLERQPRMNDREAATLRQVMRDRYAVHYSALGAVADEPDNQAKAEPRAKPSDHIDTDAGENW